MEVQAASPLFWLRSVVEVLCIAATIIAIVSPLWWQHHRFRRQLERTTLIRSAQREENRQHETLTDSSDIVGLARRH